MSHLPMGTATFHASTFGLSVVTAALRWSLLRVDVAFDGTCCLDSVPMWVAAAFQPGMLMSMLNLYLGLEDTC